MSGIKTIAVAVVMFISVQASAQTWADAQKAIWNEQPGKAKEILKGLLAKTPADAELNYRMGNLLYSEGKKDSAKVFYNKGIKPEDKINYNYAGLGKLALDENNTVAALEYFTKLTNKDKSKDTKAYTFVGEAYLHSAGKQTDPAIVALDKAVLLDPKNVEAYMLLGEAHLAKNDGGKAVTNYEFSYEKQPGLAVAYNRIGQIYMMSRNYEMALQHFQKANSLDANFIPVYKELAEFYYYAKKYTDAVKFMDEYITRSGRNDIEILEQKAKYVFLTKDYPKTISLIEELMQRDAQNIILSRLIGYSYYEQGKYPEGLTQMETFFTKVDPNKIIGSDYAYYGKLLAKNAKDSLALVYLNKAITLDSTNVDLYDDLATTLMTQKKYLESAAAYDKKMSLSRVNSQDAFQAGRGYYYGGNFAKADSSFSIVTEMQPTAVVGYLWRAKASAQIDPTSEKGLAFPHYSKFIELTAADEAKYKKDLIEAHSYLGYYYFLQKDNAKSKAEWLKVKELDPNNTQATEVLKELK